MIQYQQTNDIAPKDGVTFKAVAKYALLPGFIPLLKRLAERFGHFMHMFTMIFGAVGLIDKNHPCLRPENIGRYRFIDIIGLASHNVIFDRKHIPQTIMYFAVLSAIVLTISVMLTMALGLFIQIPAAQAQFFSNPVETPVIGDWAYNMLHDIFGKTGLSGIWNELDNDKIGSIADKAGTGSGAGINIWAIMLREMLKTYSMALLVIAVFMVIYLMVVTLIDSAVTGVPFGKKFNNVWAPIRLVMAIGLLVPISQGYNSAQLITFQVAHWGSALGTNVWISGLSKLDDRKLLTAVSPDPGYRFIRGLFLMELCYHGWNAYATSGGIISGAVQQGAQFVGLTNLGSMREYVSVPDDFTLTRVQFGTDETKSFCGEMTFATPQTDRSYIDTVRRDIGVGVNRIYYSYDKMLKEYRDAPDHGSMTDIDRYHAAFAKSYAGMIFELREKMKPYLDEIIKEVLLDESCKVADLAEKWKQAGKNPMSEWIDVYRKWLGYDESTERFFRVKNDSYDWVTLETNANKELKELIKNAQTGGWASAGSFFLIISQTISKISSAVQSTPKVISMPMVLTTKDIVPSDPRSEPTWWSRNITSQFSVNEAEASEKTNRALESANSWIKNAPQDYPDFAAKIKYTTIYNQAMIDNQSMTNKQNNADLDSFSGSVPAIYDGWWTIKSGELNPISALMFKGRSFMNMGTTFYGGAIMLSYFSPALGTILFSFGSMAFLAGITLLVVLPAMPFIYFFFAVVEWGMSVLEAVIGMPLWALSFINIEGDGFGAAKKGVLMLFEIMLRPAIIIFSLLGSAIIFSAGIILLNVSFAAFDDTYQRSSAWAGGISGLVTSISSYFLYLFIAYSLGMSSFKLMVSLPGNFMRWFESVKGFGDMIDAGTKGANPYLLASQFNQLTGGFQKELKIGDANKLIGQNQGPNVGRKPNRYIDGKPWRDPGDGNGDASTTSTTPTATQQASNLTGAQTGPSSQGVRLGRQYPAPSNMGGNIPGNAGQGARVGQQRPAPGGPNPPPTGGNNANIPPIAAPGGGVSPSPSGSTNVQPSAQGGRVGNTYAAPEGYSRSKWSAGDSANIQGGSIKAGDNPGADDRLRADFDEYAERMKYDKGNDEHFGEFKKRVDGLNDQQRGDYLKSGKWED
jgi:conjugal transfer/type IV secretion protein DotA/TraY